MNLPTFKIRDSDGQPSEHEAVHIIYVREMQREHARYKAALERIANVDYHGNRDSLSVIAHEALANTNYQTESVATVGSSVAVRRLDCYVGIKSCGCMVAWVYDDPKYPKDVAKSVADFIRSGYSVERANTDEVRHKLGKCKCAKPSDIDWYGQNNTR